MLRSGLLLRRAVSSLVSAGHANRLRMRAGHYERATEGHRHDAGDAAGAAAMYGHGADL